MLADTTVRDWLIDTGFSLVEKILLSANHNIEHFRDAYVKLIDYVKCPENWEQIEEELKGRKVRCGLGLVSIIPLTDNGIAWSM